MVPDLRQMRYVVEVAREQILSRAASNLLVAQQAVSQQVKAIEDANRGATSRPRVPPSGATSPAVAGSAWSSGRSASSSRAVSR